MRRNEQGEKSDGRMIVQTLRVGSRSYEQRWNRCGKANCSTCNGASREANKVPGHGPYWYLVVSMGRKVLRVYIGKILNTEVYVMPNGDLDFGQIRLLRAERLDRKAKKLREGGGGNGGNG